MAAIIAARALSIFFFFETENSEIRDHAIFYFSLEMMKRKEMKRKEEEDEEEETSKSKARAKLATQLVLIPI